MFYIILYYIIALIGVFMFFLGLKKYKFSLISLTGISYIISIFVVILPGYFISTGIYFEEFGFSRGFSTEIYVIYLMFSILFPSSIILGRLIGNKYYITTNYSYSSEKNMHKYFLFAFLIFCFTIINVGPMNIPIINLVLNNDILEAMRLKFEMRNNPSMFVFTKYLQYFMMFTMLWTFYYFIKNKLIFKNKNKILFYIGIIIMLFILLVRLGRDDIVQFIFILIIGSGIIKKSNYLFLKLIVLFLIMMILWTVISPYEQSINEILHNIFMRIVVQTGFSYLQLTTLNGDFLWIEGIQMPLVGTLLGQELISPSKEAYNLFYNRDTGYGTAGLSFAQMYFIFGFIGIIIASALIVIVSIIDQIFIQSILMSKSNNKKIENISFLVASYLTFITLFYIQIITNFFSFFSFPFIFSFTFYNFLLMLLILLKFKFKILKSKGKE